MVFRPIRLSRKDWAYDRVTFESLSLKVVEPTMKNVNIRCPDIVTKVLDIPRSSNDTVTSVPHSSLQNSSTNVSASWKRSEMTRPRTAVIARSNVPPCPDSEGSPVSSASRAADRIRYVVPADALKVTVAG